MTKWTSFGPRYGGGFGFTTDSSERRRQVGIAAATLRVPTILPPVAIFLLSKTVAWLRIHTGRGSLSVRLQAGSRAGVLAVGPILMSGGLTVATSNPAFSRDLFPGYEQVYGVPAARR